MARNAASKNKTQNSYNSTNETDATSKNHAKDTCDKTTSKNHAYNTTKSCHTDSYDENEME